MAVQPPTRRNVFLKIADRPRPNFFRISKNCTGQEDQRTTYEDVLNITEPVAVTNISTITTAKITTISTTSIYEPFLNATGQPEPSTKTTVTSPDDTMDDDQISTTSNSSSANIISFDDVVELTTIPPEAQKVQIMNSSSTIGEITPDDTCDEDTEDEPKKEEMKVVDNEDYDTEYVVDDAAVLLAKQADDPSGEAMKPGQPSKQFFNTEVTITALENHTLPMNMEPIGTFVPMPKTKATTQFHGVLGGKNDQTNMSNCTILPKEEARLEFEMTTSTEYPVSLIYYPEPPKYSFTTSSVNEVPSIPDGLDYDELTDPQMAASQNPQASFQQFRSGLVVKQQTEELVKSTLFQPFVEGAQTGAIVEEKIVATDKVIPAKTTPKLEVDEGRAGRQSTAKLDNLSTIDVSRSKYTETTDVHTPQPALNQEVLGELEKQSAISILPTIDTFRCDSTTSQENAKLQQGLNQDITERTEEQTSISTLSTIGQFGGDQAINNKQNEINKPEAYQNILRFSPGLPITKKQSTTTAPPMDEFGGDDTITMFPISTIYLEDDPARADDTQANTAEDHFLVYSSEGSTSARETENTESLRPEMNSHIEKEKTQKEMIDEENGSSAQTAETTRTTDQSLEREETTYTTSMVDDQSYAEKLAEEDNIIPKIDDLLSIFSTADLTATTVPAPMNDVSESSLEGQEGELPTFPVNAPESKLVYLLPIHSSMIVPMPMNHSTVPVQSLANFQQLQIESKPDLMTATTPIPGKIPIPSLINNNKPSRSLLQNNPQQCGEASFSDMPVVVQNFDFASPLITKAPLQFTNQPQSSDSIEQSVLDELSKEMVSMLYDKAHMDDGAMEYSPTVPVRVDFPRGTETTITAISSVVDNQVLNTSDQVVPSSETIASLAYPDCMTIAITSMDRIIADSIEQAQRNAEVTTAPSPTENQLNIIDAIAEAKLKLAELVKQSNSLRSTGNAMNSPCASTFSAPATLQECSGMMNHQKRTDQPLVHVLNGANESMEEEELHFATKFARPSTLATVVSTPVRANEFVGDDDFHDFSSVSHTTPTSTSTVTSTSCSTAESHKTTASTASPCASNTAIRRHSGCREEITKRIEWTVNTRPALSIVEGIAENELHHFSTTRPPRMFIHVNEAADEQELHHFSTITNEPSTHRLSATSIRTAEGGPRIYNDGEGPSDLGQGEILITENVRPHYEDKLSSTGTGTEIAANGELETPAIIQLQSTRCAPSLEVLTTDGVEGSIEVPPISIKSVLTIMPSEGILPDATTCQTSNKTTQDVEDYELDDADSVLMSISYASTCKSNPCVEIAKHDESEEENAETTECTDNGGDEGPCATNPPDTPQCPACTTCESSTFCSTTTCATPSTEVTTVTECTPSTTELTTVTECTPPTTELTTVTECTPSTIECTLSSTECTPPTTTECTTPTTIEYTPVTAECTPSTTECTPSSMIECTTSSLECTSSTTECTPSTTELTTAMECTPSTQCTLPEPHVKVTEHTDDYFGMAAVEVSNDELHFEVTQPEETTTSECTAETHKKITECVRTTMMEDVIERAGGEQLHFDLKTTTRFNELAELTEWTSTEAEYTIETHQKKTECSEVRLMTDITEGANNNEPLRFNKKPTKAHMKITECNEARVVTGIAEAANNDHLHHFHERRSTTAAPTTDGYDVAHSIEDALRTTMQKPSMQDEEEEGELRTTVDLLHGFSDNPDDEHIVSEINQHNEDEDEVSTGRDPLSLVMGSSTATESEFAIQETSYIHPEESTPEPTSLATCITSSSEDPITASVQTDATSSIDANLNLVESEDQTEDDACGDDSDVADTPTGAGAGDEGGPSLEVNESSPINWLLENHTEEVVTDADQENKQGYPAPYDEEITTETLPQETLTTLFEPLEKRTDWTTDLLITPKPIAAVEVYSTARADAAWANQEVKELAASKDVDQTFPTQEETTLEDTTYQTSKWPSDAETMAEEVSLTPNIPPEDTTIEAIMTGYEQDGEGPETTQVEPTIAGEVASTFAELDDQPTTIPSPTEETTVRLTFPELAGNTTEDESMLPSSKNAVDLETDASKPDEALASQEITVPAISEEVTQEETTTSSDTPLENNTTEETPMMQSFDAMEGLAIGSGQVASTLIPDAALGNQEMIPSVSEEGRTDQATEDMSQTTDILTSLEQVEIDLPSSSDALVLNITSEEVTLSMEAAEVSTTQQSPIPDIPEQQEIVTDTTICVSSNNPGIDQETTPVQSEDRSTVENLLFPEISVDSSLFSEQVTTTEVTLIQSSEEHAGLQMKPVVIEGPPISAQEDIASSLKTDEVPTEQEMIQEKENAEGNAIPAGGKDEDVGIGNQKETLSSSEEVIATEQIPIQSAEDLTGGTKPEKAPTIGVAITLRMDDVWTGQEEAALEAVTEPTNEQTTPKPIEEQESKEITSLITASEVIRIDSPLEETTAGVAIIHEGQEEASTLNVALSNEGILPHIASEGLGSDVGDYQQLGCTAYGEQESLIRVETELSSELLKSTSGVSSSSELITDYVEEDEDGPLNLSSDGVEEEGISITEQNMTANGSLSYECPTETLSLLSVSGESVSPVISENMSITTTMVPPTEDSTNIFFEYITIEVSTEETYPTILSTTYAPIEETSTHNKTTAANTTIATTPSHAINMNITHVPAVEEINFACEEHYFGSTVTEPDDTQDEGTASAVGISAIEGMNGSQLAVATKQFKKNKKYRKKGGGKVAPVVIALATTGTTDQSVLSTTKTANVSAQNVKDISVSTKTTSTTEPTRLGVPIAKLPSQFMETTTPMALGAKKGKSKKYHRKMVQKQDPLQKKGVKPAAEGPSDADLHHFFDKKENTICAPSDAPKSLAKAKPPQTLTPVAKLETIEPPAGHQTITSFPGITDNTAIAGPTQFQIEAAPEMLQAPAAARKFKKPFNRKYKAKSAPIEQGGHGKGLQPATEGLNEAELHHLMWHTGSEENTICAPCDASRGLLFGDTTPLTLGARKFRKHKSKKYHGKFNAPKEENKTPGVGVAAPTDGMNEADLHHFTNVDKGENTICAPCYETGGSAIAGMTTPLTLGARKFRKHKSKQYQGKPTVQLMIPTEGMNEADLHHLITHSTSEENTVCAPCNSSEGLASTATATTLTLAARKFRKCTHGESLPELETRVSGKGVVPTTDGLNADDLHHFMANVNEAEENTICGPCLEPESFVFDDTSTQLGDSGAPAESLSVDETTTQLALGTRYFENKLFQEKLEQIQPAANIQTSEESQPPGAGGTNKGCNLTEKSEQISTLFFLDIKQEGELTPIANGDAYHSVEAAAEAANVAETTTPLASGARQFKKQKEKGKLVQIETAADVQTSEESQSSSSESPGNTKKVCNLTLQTEEVSTQLLLETKQEVELTTIANEDAKNCIGAPAEALNVAETTTPLALGARHFKKQKNKKIQGKLVPIEPGADVQTSEKSEASPSESPSDAEQVCNLTLNSEEVSTQLVLETKQEVELATIANYDVGNSMGSPAEALNVAETTTILALGARQFKKPKNKKIPGKLLPIASAADVQTSEQSQSSSCKSPSDTEQVYNLKTEKLTTQLLLETEAKPTTTANRDAEDSMGAAAKALNVAETTTPLALGARQFKKKKNKKIQGKLGPTASAADIQTSEQYQSSLSENPDDTEQVCNLTLKSEKLTTQLLLETEANPTTIANRDAEDSMEGTDKALNVAETTTPLALGARKFKKKKNKKMQGKLVPISAAADIQTSEQYLSSLSENPDGTEQVCNLTLKSKKLTTQLLLETEAKLTTTANRDAEDSMGATDKALNVAETTTPLTLGARKFKKKKNKKIQGKLVPIASAADIQTSEQYQSSLSENPDDTEQLCNLSLKSEEVTTQLLLETKQKLKLTTIASGDIGNSTGAPVKAVNIDETTTPLALGARQFKKKKNKKLQGKLVPLEPAVDVQNSAQHQSSSSAIPDDSEQVCNLTLTSEKESTQLLLETQQEVELTTIADGDAGNSIAAPAETLNVAETTTLLVLGARQFKKKKNKKLQGKLVPIEPVAKVQTSKEAQSSSSESPGDIEQIYNVTLKSEQVSTQLLLQTKQEVELTTIANDDVGNSMGAPAETMNVAETTTILTLGARQFKKQKNKKFQEKLVPIEPVADDQTSEESQSSSSESPGDNETVCNLTLKSEEVSTQLFLETKQEVELTTIANDDAVNSMVAPAEALNVAETTPLALGARQFKKKNKKLQGGKLVPIKPPPAVQTSEQYQSSLSENPDDTEQVCNLTLKSEEVSTQLLLETKQKVELTTNVNDAGNFIGAPAEAQNVVDTTTIQHFKKQKNKKFQEKLVPTEPLADIQTSEQSQTSSSENPNDTDQVYNPLSQEEFTELLLETEQEVELTTIAKGDAGISIGPPVEAVNVTETTPLALGARQFKKKKNKKLQGKLVPIEPVADAQTSKEAQSGSSESPDDTEEVCNLILKSEEESPQLLLETKQEVEHTTIADGDAGNSMVAPDEALNVSETTTPLALGARQSKKKKNKKLQGKLAPIEPAADGPTSKETQSSSSESPGDTEQVCNLTRKSEEVSIQLLLKTKQVEQTTISTDDVGTSMVAPTEALNVTETTTPLVLRARPFKKKKSKKLQGNLLLIEPVAKVQTSKEAQSSSSKSPGPEQICNVTVKSGEVPTQLLLETKQEVELTTIANDDAGNSIGAPAEAWNVTEATTILALGARQFKKQKKKKFQGKLVPIEPVADVQNSEEAHPSSSEIPDDTEQVCNLTLKSKKVTTLLLLETKQEIELTTVANNDAGNSTGAHAEALNVAEATTPLALEATHFKKQKNKKFQGKLLPIEPAADAQAPEDVQSSSSKIPGDTAKVCNLTLESGEVSTQLLLETTQEAELTTTANDDAGNSMGASTKALNVAETTTILALGARQFKKQKNKKFQETLVPNEPVADAQTPEEAQSSSSEIPANTKQVCNVTLKTEEVSTQLLLETKQDVELTIIANGDAGKSMGAPAEFSNVAETTTPMTLGARDFKTPKNRKFQWKLVPIEPAVDDQTSEKAKSSASEIPGDTEQVCNITAKSKEIPTQLSLEGVVTPIVNCNAGNAISGSAKALNETSLEQSTECKAGENQLMLTLNPTEVSMVSETTTPLALGAEQFETNKNRTCQSTLAPMESVIPECSKVDTAIASTAKQDANKAAAIDINVGKDRGQPSEGMNEQDLHHFISNVNNAEITICAPYNQYEDLVFVKTTTPLTLGARQFKKHRKEKYKEGPLIPNVNPRFPEKVDQIDSTKIQSVSEGLNELDLHHLKEQDGSTICGPCESTMGSTIVVTSEAALNTNKVVRQQAELMEAISTDGEDTTLGPKPNKEDHRHLSALPWPMFGLRLKDVDHLALPISQIFPATISSTLFLNGTSENVSGWYPANDQNEIPLGICSTTMESGFHLETTRTVDVHTDREEKNDEDEISKGKQLTIADTLIPADAVPAKHPTECITGQILDRIGSLSMYDGHGDTTVSENIFATESFHMQSFDEILEALESTETSTSEILGMLSSINKDVSLMKTTTEASTNLGSTLELFTTQDSFLTETEEETEAQDIRHDPAEIHQYDVVTEEIAMHVEDYIDDLNQTPFKEEIPEQTTINNLVHVFPPSTESTTTTSEEVFDGEDEEDDTTTSMETSTMEFITSNDSSEEIQWTEVPTTELTFYEDPITTTPQSSTTSTEVSTTSETEETFTEGPIIKITDVMEGETTELLLNWYANETTTDSTRQDDTTTEPAVGEDEAEGCSSSASSTSTGSSTPATIATTDELQNWYANETARYGLSSHAWISNLDNDGVDKVEAPTSVTYSGLDDIEFTTFDERINEAAEEELSDGRARVCGDGVYTFPEISTKEKTAEPSTTQEQFEGMTLPLGVNITFGNISLIFNQTDWSKVITDLFSNNTNNLSILSVVTHTTATVANHCDITINLPTYFPNSSEVLGSFEDYYTTIATTVSVFDDEESDITINPEQFRSMRLQDFFNITEFTTMATTRNETTKDVFTLIPTRTFLSMPVPRNIVDDKGHAPQAAMKSSQVITSLHNHSLEMPALWKNSSIVISNLSVDLPPNIAPLPIKPIEIKQECNAKDFGVSKNCMCSIDSLIVDLRNKTREKDYHQVLDAYLCPAASKKTNITISNPETGRYKRKLSSIDFIFRKPRKVNDPSLHTVFLNDIQLEDTDYHIYATPGSKIRIPCIGGSNNNNSEEMAKSVWSFSDGTPLTEGKTQEKDGALIIENIIPQDAGNYTCKNGGRKYPHQLSTVTLASYKIASNILYAFPGKCTNEYLELMYSSFPVKFEDMLCGESHSICYVNVTNRCVTKKTDFVMVAMQVVVEPLTVILPTLDQNDCKISCQQNIYAKIVSILLKNVEIFETLPIFYSLGEKKFDLVPTPASKDDSTDKTQLPVMNVQCFPGFGLIENTHICNACGKNMYSTGENPLCIKCPPRQYQPNEGSKSCLTCNTYLEDPACLPLPIEMNIVKFKILVGCLMTAVFLLIGVCLCLACKSTQVAHHDSLRSLEEEGAFARKRRRQRQKDVAARHNMSEVMPLNEKLPYAGQTKAPSIPQVPVAQIPNVPVAQLQQPPSPPPPDFL